MLIELLRRAARDRPRQPATLSDARALAYADCLQRSEALARGLHERSVARFACLVEDVGELLALLCASSATGGEACVYPDDLDGAGVEEYAAAFDHEVLVSDRRPPPSSGIRVLSLDELAAGAGELPPPSERAPALILTTGTTGRPKGALHDWSRLVPPARGSPEGPGHRWLFAYNPHQFGGIQVLLHVLASQGTLVVPASRRAADALRAIREHGVTHASATPSFWRLLAALLDPETARELPLRQITLGGEAVPGPLLEELRRLFPHARVSQVYGSTEFGTSVSVRDDRAGLPVSVLSRSDESDVQLEIRDGQLYARSRVGMRGYWGQEEPEGGWRPTGDLVEVRGDRIHFVGRVGDTINVGGVKVHPLPVEEVVGLVEGVQLARAYGRANPVTGQIVALDVVPRPGADTEALEEAIRAACESLPPAGRPRLIRFVTELGMRGHKIARRPGPAAASSQAGT